MCKIKEFAKTLSETTSMSKKEYLLTAAVCFLGGIVLGIFCSPKKRSMIGSCNGNHGWKEGYPEDIWEDSDWEEDAEELPFR